MFFKRAIPALLAFALALTVVPARAVIVERIVAIVGDKPILLSDLRHRAKPRLVMVALQTQNDPTQLIAAEPRVYKETLDDMIDERLLEQQADKSHIAVNLEEIDRALKQKSDELHVSTEVLLNEAQKQGFTEQDYRDEIRRQLLEGKLITMRFAGRVRITDQDGRAAYQAFIKELGGDLVDLQAIAMRLVANPAAIEAKEALAQQIVLQARAGGDYCKLVEMYSDDAQTRTSCGSRGIQPVNILFPVVREQLAGMSVGEVSNPIRIGQEVIVIFRLNKRQPIPPYEQVSDQMLQRATADAIERGRKAWMADLRRQIFLDIRL